MIKEVLKKITPRQVKRFWADTKIRKKSTEEIFTEIYDKNLWGEAPDGRKYCSGSGTIDSNIEKYIETLKLFIKEHEINSISEIGCGDFSIMKFILHDSNIEYTGSDIVKSVTDYLSDKYGSKNVKFMNMDAITSEKFPPADLCIIRQVLQHLSNEQISEIIRKTGDYKYIIITEHLPLDPKCKNGDKSASGYIRLQNPQTSGVYLDEPPFSLNCKTLLSYRQDDKDYSGKTVPAVMVTSLIEN
jgi:hypothetical protein